MYLIWHQLSKLHLLSNAVNNDKPSVPAYCQKLALYVSRLMGCEHIDTPR